MDRGFFTILGSQFLSALADNALFVAALFLLKQQAAPEWHASILLMSFTASYVLLAPFAGPFADSIHKGQVMMICNTIKFIGCVFLFIGFNPLLAYALVGFGAATYSPAKYGLVTEYVSHDRLVLANSWLEGATILAIISGTALGGLLITPGFFTFMQEYLSGVVQLNAAEMAIAITGLIYIGAFLLNLYIPKLNVILKPFTLQPGHLIQEFSQCVIKLWRDPYGQLSLLATSVLWGLGSMMRLVIINWAIIWLYFDLDEATKLVAVFGVGTTIGAAIAGRYITLKNAFHVLPTGIAIGFFVCMMLFAQNIAFGIVLLVIVGALAGYLVVPLNAMLQHRGYNLMGSGPSIAVQNFHENLGIILMLGLHALLVKYFSTPVFADAPQNVVAYFAHTGGIPPMYLIIIGTGVLFALFMGGAMLRYKKIRRSDQSNAV